MEKKRYVVTAMSSMKAAVTPTPIPILAPLSRPESEALLEFVAADSLDDEGVISGVAVPLLSPVVLGEGDVVPRVENPVSEGDSLPLVDPVDPGLGPAVMESPFVVSESFVVELTSLLSSSELGDSVPAVGDPVGVCPAKYDILSSVPRGSEAMFCRVFASLKATVADAASVQEQKEPGCKVDGSPSCEQMAHSPSLSSQRVSATHGWSTCLPGQVLSLYSASVHPAQYVRKLPYPDPWIPKHALSARQLSPAPQHVWWP